MYKHSIPDDCLRCTAEAVEPLERLNKILFNYELTALAHVGAFWLTELALN
jgi:hypothetical protein